MTTFKIEKARLSFPSLWVPTAFAGGENKKYSATLILPKDKNKALIKQMLQATDALYKQKWGDKKQKHYSALQNGDDLETPREEYEASFILKANNRKRVPIVDKDLSLLVEEDERPLAGDYVNAKVRFYAHERDGRKMILCSLEAVQFAAEGERFGGGGNALEGFDDISGETAEDVFEEAEEFLA